MITSVAFEALFKAHYVRLHRLAMSLLHDTAESEDAVSEVMANLWKNQPDVAPERLPDYLSRATYNHCINVLTRRARQEKLQADYRQELLFELKGRDSEQGRLQAVMHYIEHDLPPRTRQAFDLCFGRGMTYRQTAEAMEVTVAAVNKHIVTGLRMLRKHFHPESD